MDLGGRKLRVLVAVPVTSQSAPGDRASAINAQLSAHHQFKAAVGSTSAVDPSGRDSLACERHQHNFLLLTSGRCAVLQGVEAQQ